MPLSPTGLSTAMIFLQAFLKRPSNNFSLCKMQLLEFLQNKRTYHIIPMLKSLHWLPVSHRTDFKALLLVYKSLNGTGPNDLSDMFQQYTPARPLRSLEKYLQVISELNMVKRLLAAMLLSSGTNFLMTSKVLQLQPVSNLDLRPNCSQMFFVN